jgi:hypothetical protein
MADQAEREGGDRGDGGQGRGCPERPPGRRDSGYDRPDPDDDPAEAADRLLYPVVIFKARYGGIYEGAPWIAVRAHADPQYATSPLADVRLAGCQDGDLQCADWYGRAHRDGTPVGRGTCPNAALADLARQLGAAWTPGQDDPVGRLKRAVRGAREDSGAHQRSVEHARPETD